MKVQIINLKQHSIICAKKGLLSTYMKHVVNIVANTDERVKQQIFSYDFVYVLYDMLCG